MFMEAYFESGKSQRNSQDEKFAQRVARYTKALIQFGPLDKEKRTS
jgi:hypothetical protein